MHAETPPFVPRSTVGAGDALLAGYLSIGEGAAALVEAVAWGASAARQPGTGGPTPADLDREAVRLHKNPDPERKLRGESTA